MKHDYTLYIVLLALLTGCTQERIEIPSQEETNKTIELVASVDVPSRVGFDSSGAFYWSTEDNIGVPFSSDPKTFVQMTITNGVGTNTGTFKGTGDGTLGSYAVYPYNTEHNLNGSILSYTFPESYNYGTSIDTDFHSETKGYGNSFNAPMWGVIDQNHISFKHLGGVFCIKLTEMPGMDTFNTLTIQADQRLTGKYETDLSETTPVLTVDNSTSGKKEVSFSFRINREIEQGVFYVPVPTGTYTNVKLILNNVEKKSIPLITVKRAHLITISDFYTVSTMEDAQEKLNNPNINNIVINNKAAVSSSNLKLIPSTDYKRTSITFKGKAANITIEENTENSDQVYQDVNLNMNGNQSGNLTVNLPQSTVKLSSIGSKTTFDKVTTTTALNTLTIQSGIDITSLDVKKGNVKVYAGASIGSITKSGTLNCKLFTQEGARIPDTLPEGIEKVSDINTVSDLTVQQISPIHAAIFLNPNEECIMSPNEFFNYGICYSTTNPVPTIEDNKIDNFRIPESYGKGKGEPWNTNYLLYGQPEETIYYRSYMKYENNSTVYYSEVKTCKLSALAIPTTTEEVDLGLSVIWRNWNLGADAPEKEGNLYRWGETTPYTTESGKYPFESITGMVDATNTLISDCDAASKATSGNYRMPTRTEIEELKNQCIWGNLSYMGVKGRLVVAPNGKYIFLPKHYSESVQNNPAGHYLVYWSSVYDPSTNPDKQAYCIFDGEVKFSSWQNKDGLSVETLWPVHKAYMIRPVRVKK